MGAGNKALLEQLGLQKSELIKEPSTGPPETFPSLQFRPVKVVEERSEERKYLLVVKKEMREHMRNSEYALALDTKKPDMERYSDRFHCLNGTKTQLQLPWDRFPKELRPRAGAENAKASRGKRKLEANKRELAPKTKKRRTRDVDVKQKLEELEEREKGRKEEEEEAEEEEEGAEGAVEEVEEDLDEEMDEGTDYINNYFDNGENYLEDDGDPLEEGGVF